MNCRFLIDDSVRLKLLTPVRLRQQIQPSTTAGFCSENNFEVGRLRYRTIASCGNEENNLLYLFHEPKLNFITQKGFSVSFAVEWIDVFTRNDY